MEVTKRHCHTGAQTVEWKSELQSKSGGRQGFPFLRKHSASGVCASSNLRIRRLDDLPAELIVNILSRLPVKSIMCCRCICKIWRNIIDSPSFTNMHFTSRRADTTEEPQLMLVCRPNQRQGKMRLFTIVDAGTEVLRSSEFPIAEIANSYGYFAESLCYGLFCFRNFYDIRQVFLLNPLRGEVLMLPPATVTPYPDVYGVGFDCTTETYKVVHFFSRKSNYVLQQHDLATEVYTLGTRSWRQIPTVPPCYLSGRAVSAFGDVHWLGHRWFPDGSDESDEVMVMIMSFDTRKEEFKLTPHPNLPTKLFNSFHLLDFRGHLAMVDNSSTTHLEIWVLKDYNKEWAIEYRISAELLFGQQKLNIGFQTRTLMLRNVGVGAGGHVLLFQIGCNDLVYYDPRTDSVKFTCIPPPDLASFDKRIFGYTGSLISLKNSGNMIAREAGLRNYFDLSTADPVSVLPQVKD